MKTTCKNVLLDYINSNPGWIKKVHLYAVAEEWDAETVCRELRTLEEDKLIEGGYYDGTRRKVKLKKYCSLTTEKPKAQRPVFEEINGKLTAVFKEYE